MTSMSVKDANFLVNFIGQKGAPATENAGNHTDFGDVMARAANRASNLKHSPNRENLLKMKPAVSERPKNEPVKLSESKEPEKSTKATNEVSNEAGNGKALKVDDKINEKLEETRKAAEEIVSTIAMKFEITPEEVIEILAALDMMPESLLDPAILRDVIVALNGSDLPTLMTDAIMYEKFTELSTEIQTTIGELMETTELAPDEMKLLIAQLKAMENMEEEINPEKLTESVNQSGHANQTNDLAIKQANEPEQQITITVEKDGVITEVTAKTDANGNLGATKDVTITETEPTVTVELKENTEDQQSKQNSNQNNGQSNNGYESILNNLLQNRVSAVEAKFEPIAFEAPNTQQIINQILDFMKIKLTPEIDSLEMQLHPASLGTVNVKIASTAGVITAQFTAQNEVVKAAIESQIVELKENMRAQGMKVESIEVNVKSQEFDSKLWQGKDENTQEEQNSRKNRRRINLSGLDLDELLDDISGEEKLATEMMIENGQTVDFSA